MSGKAEDVHRAPVILIDCYGFTSSMKEFCAIDFDCTTTYFDTYRDMWRRCQIQQGSGIGVYPTTIHMAT